MVVRLQCHDDGIHCNYGMAVGNRDGCARCSLIR
jgi:murein endopeptidase